MINGLLALTSEEKLRGLTLYNPERSYLCLRAAGGACGCQRGHVGIRGIVDGGKKRRDN